MSRTIPDFRDCTVFDKSHMETVGKVNNIPVHHVEWIIPNFFSLSKENSRYYDSCPFSFNGESWYLRIYPNGDEDEDSVGYVDLFLKRKSTGPSISVDFTLHLKSIDGKEVEREKYSCKFGEKNDACGCCCFISRSRLLRKKFELVPCNELTVVCTLKYPNASTDKAPGSYTLLQKSKILQDFKELFLNKDHCDVVFRVKGHEFPAHKAILSARSPVFASAFRSDMKEKATGIVDIVDYDPSSFSDFLYFLYCDNVDSLSEGNVFSLFSAADKYDVPDLRTSCMEFVKQNLSVGTFCETIILALRHTELELIHLATDFFIKNAEKITKTVQWQSFVAENPTQSNELFIKFMASDRCIKA